MDIAQQTVRELSKRAAALPNLTALVGLDGFVDRLVTAVDQRSGPGKQFTPMTHIEQFGQRILNAAGKSTNIELFPKAEKLGGNGPIMANALHTAGLQVSYIGALGRPDIHPVFSEFSQQTQVFSLSDPGITHAVEFNDGKIMLGSMEGLDQVHFQAMLEVIGEGILFDLFSRVDLIALLNWTMLPHMTAVLTSLLHCVFPYLGPRDRRCFFFDLADPDKRSSTDIRTVLDLFSRFQSYGNVTLGLNLKEAQKVASVLEIHPPQDEPESLKQAASRIRQELNLHTVVIHPTRSAACATRDDAVWLAGPYCEAPKVTTGAGDHFNSGFAIGQLLDLPLPVCLNLANTSSGCYVRTGHSPTINDISQFLQYPHE